MKILYSFLILFATLHASECLMHIEKVQNDTDKYTLTLTHDKGCEIIMDEHSSKIVLVSKALETSDIEQNITIGVDNPIDRLLSLAKSKLGNSYVYAAAGPDYFDCSGFVYYLFKESGVNIPRSSLAQSKAGEKLTREELTKGDILFFDTHERGHVNHSGVYLGNGRFIHSSSGKAYGVTISYLDKGFYKDKFRWGIRKIRIE